MLLRGPAVRRSREMEMKCKVGSEMKVCFFSLENKYFWGILLGLWTQLGRNRDLMTGGERG